ncbi:caspase family protein [Dactylosporangium sp. NPDC051541]|uniref:caspase family protein n=1 Tax=Dactylosporangium sp. NPDC051541 TaxID=3363977 RepID=UPI0037BC2580
MPRVNALLIGIDRYRRPGMDLRGCVNDIDLAERVLRDRIGPADLAVERLCDEQATRGGVIEAFRRHLGGLGPGDTALFWYSGHGSTGPLPDEIWYSENSGMCQTLVCHDSRAGAPDLYDKELAVLAREVLHSGAQLVTILDSCHSRGGMRTPDPFLTPRLAPAPQSAPTLRELLPELATDPALAAGRQLPEHIALAACDEWELANERPFADGWHGIFTEALCHALARLGPDVTYRELYSHARCRVEGRLSRQVPTLEALEGVADREFLGGAMRSRAARIVMRHLHGRWELNTGALHGAVAGARFGVHGAEPLREVDVVAVHPHRSIVEPDGWAPDTMAQYEMVLTDVPLPPVAVSIDADPDVIAALTGAVQVSGAGGGPSPHIRIVPPADAATSALRLRVQQVDRARTLQITGPDGKPLAAPVPADGAGIEQTVRDLEHIARWLQVRNLESGSPALQDAVRLEVVPARPDGSRPPRGQAQPVAAYDCTYRWDGARWVPPTVYIRLHNTTDRKLYCVLLDLTDRHRMHANLFPGEFVAAQWTVEAANRGPITASLPPERPVEPGASVTDWLVLLVAEEQFSSDPFALPRLREVPDSAARGARPGITGVLDRLGLLAVRRDLDAPPPPVALDWAVTVVEFTTRVP